MSWKSPQIFIPLAFFSYAIFANAAVIRQGTIDLSSVSDLVTGGVAQQIDELYRKHLPLRDVAVGAIGALRYALLNDGRLGVIVGKPGWLFSGEELRSHGDDTVPVEQSVAGIEAIGKDLAALGMSLVIVPIPAKIDIAESLGGLPAVSEKRRDEYFEFVSLLTESGLTVVDAYETYTDIGPGAFFATDTHWRPNTATQVALAVAEIIKIGDEDFILETQPEEIFTGDLVRFITSDEYAPLLGLASETTTAYVALAEQNAEFDIFATTATANIVLIGTSYSANPKWSFVEALKLALHQDVLNFAREGLGPVTPMHIFIDEGRLSLETMPETIIWEFPIRYLTDPALWPKSAEAYLDET